MPKWENAVASITRRSERFAATITSERVVPPWPKGSVPDIFPPGQRAAMMTLFEVDAAETQAEWDFAIGKLIHQLLLEVTEVRLLFGQRHLEVLDAVNAIAGRIMAGFKAPPRRPRHVIIARDDALWLSGLPPTATLLQAIASLADLRGISDVEARRRVLRAEVQLQRRFRRTSARPHLARHRSRMTKRGGL